MELTRNCAPPIVGFGPQEGAPQNTGSVAVIDRRVRHHEGDLPPTPYSTRGASCALRTPTAEVKGLASVQTDVRVPQSAWGTPVPYRSRFPQFVHDAAYFILHLL